METISKAVIIAAGIGNRLRPVTETVPKPLVRVEGVRLIDTTIEALKQNGIREIYIVTGYRKEQFYEAYGHDPVIHILENPHYLEGNNITSIYAAREHLGGAFIIEGDLLIRNADIYCPETEGSAYCAYYMKDCPEWALKLKDGRVSSCTIEGGADSYRNLGISMWTRKDGERLARLVEEQIEKTGDWSIYWDEVPLRLHLDQFQIGIREVAREDVTEIDTVDELIALDPSYSKYARTSQTAC